MSQYPICNRCCFPVLMAASHGEISASDLRDRVSASLELIADVELFFRWVRQTLKIRHFLGTGENAIRIQLAVALIALLLLRLALATQSAVQAPLAFARLVRANLMHRRRIDRLLSLVPDPQPDTAQLALQLA
jgi:hypothetical protein